MCRRIYLKAEIVYIRDFLNAYLFWFFTIHVNENENRKLFQTWTKIRIAVFNFGEPQNSEIGIFECTHIYEYEGSCYQLDLK